jgi:hypothetical protein
MLPPRCMIDRTRFHHRTMEISPRQALTYQPGLSLTHHPGRTELLSVRAQGALLMVQS